MNKFSIKHISILLGYLIVYSIVGVSLSRYLREAYLNLGIIYYVIYQIWGYFIYGLLLSLSVHKGQIRLNSWRYNCICIPPIVISVYLLLVVSGSIRATLIDYIFNISIRSIINMSMILLGYIMGTGMKKEESEYI